ncbi:MAG: hydantoinase/oxoprolinase family protein [Desulfovibrio sp.]|jgi:N-methylhydantoinase A/oxoprolinase/acetone carboxylase beta subunit|nr:hydantoinase/oxoprolinase family protein [Desulfovibrio sp.]
MLIGLDVGGTHTDAVLVDSQTGQCVAAVKARTYPDDVLPGILEALRAVLQGGDSRRARRLCVSSTLGLNALLTGKVDSVGMLVVPGPGMNPRLFWDADPLFHVLAGSQDHRGRIVAPCDETAVTRILRNLRAEGVRAIGIVSKFSPKNAALEQRLAAFARKVFEPDAPVILGSKVSGSLNFPRRMHTVWCNAALARVSRSFAASLTAAAAELGLSCPVTVLKADAGVFSADHASRDPASAMGSGPAASLLGVWALRPPSSDGVSPASRPSSPDTPGSDTLMIDMGGTTTDLALLAGGFPLLARKGLHIAGRPTAIRSLWTRSIALGGDSSLRFVDGQPCIGPDRSGPALALRAPDEQPADRPPTLTDALNVLGLTVLGNPKLSLEAMHALAALAGSPAGDPLVLSELFVAKALHTVRQHVETLLEEVNAQPVYTIRELLVSGALRPRQAAFIGGPAQALAVKAAKALGMPVFAPEKSACANAVGAALALPTLTAELYADTLLGRMSIPDFGVEKDIGREYHLPDAERDMQTAFAGFRARDPSFVEQFSPCTDEHGCGEHSIQTVYAESFAMLDDERRRGRILRLRAQLAAGLIRTAF